MTPSHHRTLVSPPRSTRYNHAIALDPSHFKALFNRAFAYHQLGECDAAIVDYNSAHALDRTNGYVLFNRGISLHSKGEFQRAIRDFSAGAKLLPSPQSVADCLMNRGFAYRQVGEYSLALADYSSSIEMTKPRMNFKVSRPTSAPMNTPTHAPLLPLLTCAFSDAIHLANVPTHAFARPPRPLQIGRTVIAS